MFFVSICTINLFFCKCDYGVGNFGWVMFILVLLHVAYWWVLICVWCMIHVCSSCIFLFCFFLWRMLPWLLLLMVPFFLSLFLLLWSFVIFLLGYGVNEPCSIWEVPVPWPWSIVALNKKSWSWKRHKTAAAAAVQKKTNEQRQLELDVEKIREKGNDPASWNSKELKTMVK